MLRGLNMGGWNLAIVVAKTHQLLSLVAIYPGRHLRK